MVTTATFAPGDLVRVPNPEVGYDIGRFVTATPGGNAVVSVNHVEKLLPLTAVAPRHPAGPTPTEKG
jgi:hypothetical protein